MQVLLLAEGQDDKHQLFKDWWRKRIYKDKNGVMCGVTVRECRQYVLAFEEAIADQAVPDINSFLYDGDRNFKTKFLYRLADIFARIIQMKPFRRDVALGHPARVERKKGIAVKCFPIAVLPDHFVDGREVV